MVSPLESPVERDHDPIQPGSPRAFGLVMAAVAALFAALSWWKAGAAWPWLAGASVAVAGAGCLAPGMLHYPNVVWFKFGLLLHRVVNPVVMLLLFVTTIVPMGLAMRAMGKDFLRSRRAPAAASYWIVRDPPGPAPAGMKDQF